MNFIEVINEAIKEAFKRSIRANAIFINKRLAATSEIVLSSFNKVQIVKPMILGLKAEITDELPEEYAFAILEVDDEKLMTEKEKQMRKQAVKEFAEKLKEIIATNQYRFLYHEENVDPFGVSKEQIDKLLAELYGADE